VNFTIRSPIATASVRGTVFDFDTVNLNVQEGLVNFSAPSGPAQPVNAGRGSSINEINHTASPPLSATDQALNPSPPVGIDSGASDAGVQTANTGGGFTPDPGPGSDPGIDPPGDSGFTVDIGW
jgi:hypothetical protein